MLDLWYRIISTLLPFDWTGHMFMKNALAAILLVTPLFGMLGTMVVSNRMAFFSDSLGHGAFTGIAIGTILGGVKPLWAATVFSILFAVGITVIKSKSKTSTDTIIGVFSSIAVSLGIIIITYNGLKNNSLLVGDILSIAPEEIIFLFFVFIIVVLLWLFLFNKLLLISINQSLAASRGINTLVVEALFTSAIAIIITATLQWVGIMLINSLLVLPAASARNITTNVRQYHLVSIAFAVFSGVCGLIISYYLNTATGATIVLTSAMIFFVTLFFKNRFA